MWQVFKKSHAKINLTLDVLGKRANGYHDLDMLMQTVNLYDTIYLRQMRAPGIRVKTNLSWLATDDRNIAYRAAELFKEKYKIEEGIFIKINKIIPVSAGLGGGSSNAAAVLTGLNELYSMDIPKSELMELGLKLGADVPYCILKQTARARGLGEELEVLPPLAKCFILLAKPKISVSTQEVFEKLDLHAIKKEDRPQTDLVVQAIKNQDLEGLALNMKNVLESVTIKEYPIIEEIKDIIVKDGALGAVMSGSGPTVFGIYKTKKEAQKTANKLRLKSLVQDAFVTTTYNDLEGSEKDEK